MLGLCVPFITWKGHGHDMLLTRYAFDNYVLSSFRPYSYIIYCNRALCYLKKEKYWSALSDGKRVVTLNPRWEKVRNYIFIDSFLIIVE